jgi:hypothetical protein
MNWDAVGIAVFGASVGALFAALATVAATWWVSVRMARQADSARLLSAMGIVEVELRENAARLELHEAKQNSEPDGGAERLESNEAASDSFDAEAARQDESPTPTLGDWAANKNTLVNLRLGNAQLWDRLHAAYGRIYTAGKAGETTGAWPSSIELLELANDLNEVSGALRRRMNSVIWRRKNGPPLTA